MGWQRVFVRTWSCAPVRGTNVAEGADVQAIVAVALKRVGLRGQCRSWIVAGGAPRHYCWSPEESLGHVRYRTNRFPRVLPPLA